MQATRLTTQFARSRQKSCTECRRRRQKCNPRNDGPCGNCARRYPPVECIMPKRSEHLSKKLKSNVEVVSSSSCRTHIPHLDERQYVSPYPQIMGTNPWSQGNRLIWNPKMENESRLSSSTSLASQDLDSYIDPERLKTEDEIDEFPHSDSVVRIIERNARASPRLFGGILTSISNTNSPTIKQTPKNAELFYLFHQCVVPNLVSVDGRGGLPPLFAEQMLPWMIQSPLMPNIAILMASYTQAQEHGHQVQRFSETLSIKAHVLFLINTFLKQDFDLVGGEALRAVIHLVIIEWFWGANVSLWAHMKGLKQMMMLRGGFEGMQDPLLVQVMILTDYELACCFERDLFLQPPPSAKEDLQTPVAYPERYSSPLLPFEADVQHYYENLEISIATAEILDKIRSLTISITSDHACSTSTSEIQNTASSINKLLRKSPAALAARSELLETESIYETVRIAALIYTSCIMSLSTFCAPLNKGLLPNLYEAINHVSLSRWKDIPGIFLWILLIAVPGSQNDAQGRFLRKKMAVAGMSIGLEDFNLGIAHLRAFWKVQRWIALERKRVEVLERS